MLIPARGYDHGTAESAQPPVRNLRFLHFAAYITARTHDTRATLWTIGSLILIFMTVRTLIVAIGA